jgi:hypothetical protein
VQHFVFEPEQSVSAWQVCRPREAISQIFLAPVCSETSSQPSPLAVLHVVSLVQKRGQLVAAAQTLPPPKSQQAWPLLVSQSELELHGLSQATAQTPLPPPPLLPGPTMPGPLLEDEEQPPNQATSTVAAIRVANTLRFFIRPSTIDEETCGTAGAFLIQFVVVSEGAPTVQNVCPHVKVGASSRHTLGVRSKLGPRKWHHGSNESWTGRGRRTFSPPARSPRGTRTRPRSVSEKDPVRALQLGRVGGLVGAFDERRCSADGSRGGSPYRDCHTRQGSIPVSATAPCA